jgi:hypothetical protein
MGHDVAARLFAALEEPTVAINRAIERARIEAKIGSQYPQLAPIYRQAVEIEERCISIGKISEPELAVIVDLCRDRRWSIGPNLASILGELANRFEMARLALIGLSMDRRRNARYNALIATHSVTSDDTKEAIVRNGLRDNCAQNRAFASDRALAFRLISLIDAVEEAVAIETDEICLFVMELNLDLLRDGFRVREMKSGEIQVIAAAGEGVTVIRNYSAETFRLKGLESILLEAKSSRSLRN